MRRITISILVLFLTLLVACSNSGGEINDQMNDNEMNTENNGQHDNETNGDEQQANTEDQTGNNDRKAENTGNQTNNNDDQSYMQDKLANSNFSEVDIEVSYEKGLEYKAEIDYDDGRIEAKIDNELSNDKITGIDAFDIIFPKIDELNLTSSSNEEEVIKQILNAFDLPTDYIEFEMEIKFHDGTELDIEKRQ